MGTRRNKKVLWKNLKVVNWKQTYIGENRKMCMRRVRNDLIVTVTSISTKCSRGRLEATCLQGESNLTPFLWVVKQILKRTWKIEVIQLKWEFWTQLLLGNYNEKKKVFIQFLGPVIDKEEWNLYPPHGSLKPVGSMILRLHTQWNFEITFCFIYYHQGK